MQGAWRQIQDILQKTVNPGLFTVWIKPLQAEVKEDSLSLTAPNEFVASWVRDRLMDDISQAAARVMGNNAAIRISAEPATSDVAPFISGQANGAGNGHTPMRSESAVGSGNQVGLPLKPTTSNRVGGWRFTFDDFVVGPSNELAYAATRGLTQETFSSDQLFLCASSGLGKTHLLQAVGSSLCAMSNRKSVHVRYVTSEEFSRQWVLACRSRDFESFKAAYRDDVDILLMEDVHFFQGKEKLQDELLATVKILRDKGAKVVFSSSFLPRELNNVDSHLASRFCAGFLAVIEKPDFDTRKRILQRKAKLFQAVLPDNVAELMADRIRSDVRQLESCLQNLVLKAKLLNKSICMDLAWQVVGNYAASTPLLSLDNIVDFVCETYELNPEQLKSKSRRRQAVLARNTAYYLARNYTNLSLKDIGDRFNRRHSTVLKGIANMEREISLETPLGRQLSRTLEMAKRFSSRSKG
ncbi:MAG: chromosomal replication initiator protein DnaA [Desulfovibrio sp.]|nr:MAG: chromosomal replication initiator protein DnaA [Desulfovibrio sp.]